MLQIADEGLAGVAAAVGVVEGAEELPDGTQGGDVAAADLLAGAAVDLALPGDAGWPGMRRAPEARKTVRARRAVRRRA